MGTSLSTTSKSPLGGDHPHAYGDKLLKYYCMLLYLGSSPRVWGQAFIYLLIVFFGRIIPTRMGTSYTNLYIAQQIQDHPHAYGDKHCNDKGMAKRIGSSPRVWGQGDVINMPKYKYRIIPTRMGTRLKKSRKIAVLQNQPLRFPLTFHRSFV